MAKGSAMKVLKTNKVKKPSSMKAMKATNSSPKNAPSSPKETMKASSPKKSMKAPTPVKSMKVKKGGKDSKQMSLDDKIQLWREKNEGNGKDAEEPDLSLEEWSKVNGRFKTAMNKNPEAKEAWENASNLSRGQGVQKAKRQAMIAWLMDPSFGRGFQEYIQSVSYDQRHSTLERPETYKQLLERYDDMEIQSMVDAWINFIICLSMFLLSLCQEHSFRYIICEGFSDCFWSLKRQ